MFNTNYWFEDKVNLYKHDTIKTPDLQNYSLIPLWFTETCCSWTIINILLFSCLIIQKNVTCNTTEIHLQFIIKMFRLWCHCCKGEEDSDVLTDDLQLSLQDTNLRFIRSRLLYQTWQCGHKNCFFSQVVGPSENTLYSNPEKLNETH